MGIRTLLIANRGEIACRIIRTCRALGIRAVAVYSEADRDALHVCLADEAYPLGPPPVAQSYVNQEAVLSAAALAKADAIHPGCGFLAENAAFARACRDRGIVFIGPTPEAIATMGNKAEARRLMTESGVHVVPGSKGNVPEERLSEIAAQVGFPLMVKASAGGGGIGIALASTATELSFAARRARSSARRAFGDESIYFERYLERPRHLEVQVLADQRSNAVHLGIRDCSVQRRHQKVVEETPAVLPKALATELVSSALAAAAAVNYVGAGTVEFLIDQRGQPYFLEMNTRLQVEHPVTEMVTGLDLVEQQIRVAEGKPPAVRQEEVVFRGHALECRLYAEDPATYLPSPGRINLLRFPEGEGIRVDAGVRQGDEVTTYYDPLLAKIVAWGEDRETALERLRQALAETAVEGVKGNLPLLSRIVDAPEFAESRYDASFLDNPK
jgi:acetyl-CoA carboxylase biotin carboxylase subunit